MPEPLKAEEVNSKTDPSVAKQWDEETPKSKQIEEFYKTVDGMKIGLLTTIRDGIGPVSRSMAVAKRTGPDFLFLANAHSQKFSDLSTNPTAQITFQNSSSQDWVSVSGTCTTTSNHDPRIKDLYSKTISAWFGDLGDGVHTGGPEDPRMALIEVKSKYISYWKSTVGTLGFFKEVGVATVTGKVADNGVQRQFGEGDIEGMRKDA
ncbi:hypothetical protein ACLMJK_001663 [Lecanora helva]